MDAFRGEQGFSGRRQEAVRFEYLRPEHQIEPEDKKPSEANGRADGVLPGMLKLSKQHRTGHDGNMGYEVVPATTRAAALAAGTEAECSRALGERPKALEDRKMRHFCNGSTRAATQIATPKKKLQQNQ
ncbi:MAG: hypothetical protein ACLP7P_03435 [Rhodomicrobium sp.]